MTEHDTELAFDRALDGERGISLNGSESLLLTAHALQTLFDRQQAAPSEHFVMQLDSRLALPTIIPSVIPSAPPVIPSEVEGPPAAAVSRPQPTPRPAPLHPKRTRTVRRWAAVAAVLILLIGGMGALFGSPLVPRSTPEPSAIPAVSFGTVEASPEAVGEIWTVAPPQGVQGSSGPAFIEDGLMYNILTGPSGPYAQVIDIDTGRALWSSRLAVSADLTASVWRGLLLFTGTGGPDYELFAFDGRTGKDRWSIPFAQRPVNLIVDGDRAFMLGSGNLVVAIDLETQQELWQTDLSAFDPDWEPYGGMNRYGYFNDGRLALTNGVLAVLISDGRLIALDADDGSQEWMAGHADDGRATVHVIDGQFVVTAEGKSIFDMDDDPYLLPPSPVPSYDPKTQPCERTVEPLSATDSSALGDYQTSATSLDPITGDPSWKVRTHAAVWIVAADDARLVAMIRPGWDSAIGNEDFPIYCSIDGETGDVARISDVELATFTYGVGQPEEPWGMGVVPSGVPFGMGHLNPELVKDLPHFELDPETFTGFRWVQKADGLILITEQDGTVAGFPENAPDSPTVEATPTIATPAADTGWTAPGPDGIADFAEASMDHVIADGRIFRAFMMKTGEPVVQAIDADSGDVLWEVDAEVKNSGDGLQMAEAGDVLLVAGASQLIALDTATGHKAWITHISNFPVTMKVSGNRALILGDEDMLDAVDVETGQTIYSVDIQGDALNMSRPFSKDLTGYDNRLAVDGDTVYAALADGSVVAVDIETGTGKWWSLRPTPGQVQVYAIDGAVVAVDQGDLAKIAATIEAESRAHRMGTPQAVASPAFISGNATCAGIESSASPDATPLPAATADDIVTSFRGLDAESGEVRWSMTLPAQSGGQVAVDDGMLYEVWAISDLHAGPTDVAVCIVDARTGVVRPIDNLAELSAETFLVQRSDDVTVTSIGVAVEGQPLFFVPAAFDSDITGPVVSLDATLGSHRVWQEVYQGSIYASLFDGDLVKIPIPAA